MKAGEQLPSSALLYHGRRKTPVSIFSSFLLPPTRSPTHSSKPQVIRGARACTVCRAAKVHLRLTLLPITPLTPVPR